MFFSLYPTDPPEVRDAVVAAARDHSQEHAVFTSLHIPEAQRLTAFVDDLRDLHKREGLTFCADISPVTLQRLGLGLEDLGQLRDAGVRWVRIDFGFAPDEIARIALTGGFRVAVNASTVTDAELDALSGVDLVGWHNFYPRPETGLTTEFVAAQNALLAQRGRDVFVFLPGERTFRAPLHLGLPMLEEHRHRNAYVTYLHLVDAFPTAHRVFAEGVPHPQHLAWIEHFEATGEVTVPLTGITPAASTLLQGTWRVRIEQTGVSERLEGTRGLTPPTEWINADYRERGSLQMDLDSYGRYAGEVHLMLRDAPLDPRQARIADIAAPYRGVVDRLRLTRTVRFVTAP